MAAGEPVKQAGEQQGAVKTPPSAFDNCRSAISSFEPVYFDIGSKGDTNARFQLSFKYRLFNPTDPLHPEFIDNLYLGYTQTSLWDLEGDSMPFIDTTYNPRSEARRVGQECVSQFRSQWSPVTSKQKPLIYNNL